MIMVRGVVGWLRATIILDSDAGPARDWTWARSWTSCHNQRNGRVPEHFIGSRRAAENTATLSFNRPLDPQMDQHFGLDEPIHSPLREVRHRLDAHQKPAGQPRGGQVAMDV